MKNNSGTQIIILKEFPGRVLVKQGGRLLYKTTQGAFLQPHLKTSAHDL